MLLLTSCLLPATTAHDANTFTVVIKEEGVIPSNPQLVYNDSVWWYNVDDRENITHRIVYDGDGDGLYNGTMDWDSGELVSECELTENGTRVDENCNVTYEITFNGTFGTGTYHYQDLVSNGTVYNGTIVVMEDIHVEEGSPVGYEFGVEEEEETSADGEETPAGEEAPTWLLAVALASGLLSVLLIALLVMTSGKSEDDENEKIAESSDGDIDEVVEEE